VFPAAEAADFQNSGAFIETRVTCFLRNARLMGIWQNHANRPAQRTLISASLTEQADLYLTAGTVGIEVITTSHIKLNQGSQLEQGRIAS
jgi:hypothetical protein